MEAYQTNYDKRWVWEVLGEGEEVSQRKHWRTTRVLSKRHTYLPDDTPEFWSWFWEIQWASNPGISWGTPNHGMLPEVTGGIPHPVPFPMPEARTHPRGAAHWLEPPFPMIMEIQWWFFLHQLVFCLEIANSSSVSLGNFLGDGKAIVLTRDVQELKIVLPIWLMHHIFMAISQRALPTFRGSPKTAAGTTVFTRMVRLRWSNAAPLVTACGCSATLALPGLRVVMSQSFGNHLWLCSAYESSLLKSERTW